MRRLLLVSVFFLSCSGLVAAEYLIKLRNTDRSNVDAFAALHGGQLELVSHEGRLYKWTTDRSVDPSWDANVEYIQGNRMYRIFESPSLIENRDALKRLALQKGLSRQNPYPDNPEIQNPPVQATGTDPLLKDSWGMFLVGADKAWAKTNQGKEIVVAVTDTGVDYNHTDLIANMWRNKAEVPGNGIDDDKNGFVDDIVGWDFASNDNKPYDLTLSLMEILFQGGNPGHGTHVTGVVGAKLNNAQGVAGVAPAVKIMALRFITEKGQGSDADAIKVIDYAVANGANVINASWGGEKSGDQSEQALTDAIQRAEAKGVIFVAAAGNGRVNQMEGKAKGFDNDNDPKPMIPASLPISNIVAVSAIDSNQNLAEFSNWGAKTVKVGAPGVKVLSTVPGNKYQDTVIDLGQIKATWDGTSMAAPFVAGSLAVIWSQNPGESWETVRDTLLENVVSIPSLSGKVVTGGRIDLKKIGD